MFVGIWQFAEVVSKKERGVVSSVAWDLYVLSIMLGGAKFWRMPSLGIERSLRFAFVLREMRLCSSQWLCNKMSRWRTHPSRRCKTDEWREMQKRRTQNTEKTNQTPSRAKRLALTWKLFQFF